MSLNGVWCSLSFDISTTNKNGLSFRQTGGTAAGSEESKHFLSAVCSALIFFSFLGAFMNMASLGTNVLTALIPGLLAAFSLPLIKKRKSAAISAAAALTVAAAFFCAVYSDASNGTLLFLNRLMAASELKQSYKYEMFTVAADPEAAVRCIRLAAIPVGIAAGVFSGMLSRRHCGLAAAVFAVLFTVAGVYLGILPETGWCVFADAAMLLAFCAYSGLNSRTVVCAGLLLGVVCFVCIYALPAESTAVSELNDLIRDSLAGQTAVYGSSTEADNKKQQETEDNFQTVDKPTDDGQDGMTVGTNIYPYLLILLFALVLFVPALLNDRRKKRLAILHSGMDSEDNAVCIRAMFLCTMRWLKLSGCRMINAPFSEYAEQLEEHLSPELRAQFENVLPLWQEAAYSTHAMQPEQRERMREYMNSVSRFVTDHSGRLKRLLIKYVYVI